MLLLLHIHVMHINVQGIIHLHNDIIIHKIIDGIKTFVPGHDKDSGSICPTLALERQLRVIDRKLSLNGGSQEDLSLVWQLEAAFDLNYCILSTLQRPPFNVHPSTSTLQRPPSTLQSPPFNVHPSTSTLQRLPSTLQSPPFNVHPPPFKVHPSKSTLQRPPSTLQSPPFKVHPSKSTLQRPPSTLQSPPSKHHRTTSTFYPLMIKSTISHQISPTIHHGTYSIHLGTPVRMHNHGCYWSYIV